MREPRMQSLLAVTAVMMCGVVASGCASTSMRTARQLETGDIVVSGSVDEVGTIVIPRVSGQVMYGFGVGDVSVHAGTSLFLYNAGLGARAYLGDNWIGTLEADVNGIPWLNGLGEYTGFYSGSMRVTNAAKSETAFYGGFYLGSHMLRDVEFEFIGANAGGVIGVDKLIRDNLGFQVEVRLSPLMINNNGKFGLFPAANSDVFAAAGEEDFTGNALFVGQVGFSLYKRFPAREELTPSDQPIPRWNDTDDDFKQEAQSRQAPAVSTPAPPQPVQPAPNTGEMLNKVKQSDGSAPVPPKPQ